MDSQAENNSKRIGLFDSGVGGLSILRYLQERAIAAGNSDMRFVYLGDTGRCPYGDRSSNQIRTFVEEIVCWLNGTGVDRVVMACNTSAAVGAGLARHLSEAPVYDLISCASTYAAANFENIGVIATSTTCRTRAFSEAIQYKNPKCRVLEIPCPDLVPLVEKGILDGPVVADTISKYASKLREAEVDSLIFGCTHFPFLEEAFRKQLPDSVKFIDPAWTLGREIFGESTIDRISAVGADVYRNNTYFCTGDPDKFASAAESCLKLPPGSLRNSVVSLPAEQLKPIESGPAQIGTVVLQSPFFSPGAASS